MKIDENDANGIDEDDEDPLGLTQHARSPIKLRHFDSRMSHNQHSRRGSSAQSLKKTSSKVNLDVAEM